MTTMNLIILGRDGVINKVHPGGITHASQWEALPGSLEAISRLNHHGYRVIVFTNQSGIASGQLDIHKLNTIHEKMHQQLSILGGHIESVLFCPHGAHEHCECRKPRAGLLLDLEQRLNHSLQDSVVVGDSLVDIQAAQTVGATPVLVRTGRGEQSLHEVEDLDTLTVYDDLADFTTQLLDNH